MNRPTQRAHRKIWMVLGLVLPALFIGAMALKQTVPVDRPAVQIKPAGDQ